MPGDLGAPADRQPNLGRRRLLVVAAGGLMVGLGALVGCGGTQPTNAAAGRTPQHPGTTTRPDATTHPAPTVSPSAPRAPSGSPRPSTVRKVSAADTPAVPRQPVYYLDEGPKVIALTIDDGPSPVYTPQVLAILREHGVTATFSMIGKSVTYYPAIARQVAEAGHTVINHTWDHANLTSLSAAAQRTEIARTSEAIHAATGVRPRMFRAPYGAWSPGVLKCCADDGLVPLDWSVDPRDWARPGVSQIVRTIMGTTRTGSIILEHDGGGDRAQTVAALKIAIPRLLSEGYRFAVP
jgi:peptidoglycan/xylan/chitin deacetylase (PgdA/CDA1 family)